MTTDSTQKPTDPAALVRRYSSSLRRWVTFAGIVLIVLIISADSYEAWQDYRRIIADNERLQVAMSRALSEQSARMLQEVDVAMSSYAHLMGSASSRVPDMQQLSQQFLSQIMRLPFVYSAAVANAKGELLAVSPKEVTLNTSLKDVEAFSAPQHAADEALYIDRPFGAAIGDTRTFALSRRISARDGGFAGVLIARVALDYLAKFYAGINVTPDTAIRLVRDDGVTLAQYIPGPASSTDINARHVERTLSKVDENVIYAHSNGVERIEVTQKVADYPIRVLVSQSMSSVLQPWIQEERSSAERTLSLAILAGVLLVALRSAINRQERLDESRHRLEQELAAIQRMDALGLLAASVAHDFNNVLTAIIGYAELIRDGAKADLPSNVHIDRLLAGAERARLLVRRVLTFDPHRSVSYRPTQIQPVLVEVLEQVQASLPPSVRLKVESPDQGLTVAGDPTEIHQVLTNLCSNAIHSMAERGVLQVVLRALEVREPELLALGQLVPGQWACVSIADSGVGLAEDQIASIFEPFYTTRHQSIGTGIGLTVVRNIILRMNGALKVESRLGSGTRMTVYWPAIPTPEGLVGEPRSAAEGIGQTILVVDDDRELVSLTEEILASLGYEPVGYSDARAAVDVFRRDPKRFDAILTDERMQPLGGLELARLVHAIEPLVPVILTTGHRDAEIDRRARQEGITEILDKPLRVNTLRQVLARQFRAIPD
ncbi:MAG: ATP-binding protein [Pseudomonadota bacterium]|nr:ATP-binding protein [Pseudomonadota bacterium]